MAGRTCLLVILCLSAGCWNSHSKEEAGNQPAVQNQPPSTVAKSSADEKAAATAKVSGSTDELGFKHTLQPRSTPPAKSSHQAEPRPPVNSSAAKAAAAHPAGDDDRYAELVPAQPIGNRAESSQAPAHDTGDSSKSPEKPQGDSQGTTLPAAIAPGSVPGPASNLPVTPDPGKAASAKADSASGDASSVGNPLRNTNGSGVTSRPQAPPQPAVPPEPVVASPEKPVSPVAVSPPAQKSELVFQTKPEETAAGHDPAPATPTAPAAEKQPGPKAPTMDSVKPGPRTNKNSGVPFDPIKENGPIFVGWPKPKLALVITGQQEGYLEPCGCAGLDRMKGGMSRRFEMFRELRQKKGWPVVGLDVGGIAKGFGKQAELKFQIAVNAMSEMHYSAVTLGLSDLHLPTAEVMALTMPANAKQKTMFVCGNVGLFAFNEALLPRTQLIAAGYKTIGITAVLGKTYIGQLVGNTDLQTIDPDKLLSEAVPMLKSRANLLILLAHTTHKEAIDLANKYPDLDLVICSDGGAEPPNNYEEIRKGGTKLIEVGEKGMYAVVLGLFDDPKQPMRYQRVTLDSRFPASREMRDLMGAYQGQLKDLDLSGLGIRPLQHPLQPYNGDFVGTEACMNCHEDSYRVWKKSPHSRAFATLQNASPPRNFDPECISCHTVGWNPSKFFPYQSGFLSEKKTPKLLNVGCEDCHGPGQLHVRAENHGTQAEQVAARKTVVVTKEEMADSNSRKQNCWSCHDLDNSPEFKFDLYWPFVKHYEKE